MTVHRFQETTLELLSGVTELNFDRLNWGDDEAVQLAVVLPLCAKLATLTLIGNKVGDKGATALAVAIKGSRSLTELVVHEREPAFRLSKQDEGHDQPERPVLPPEGWPHQPTGSPDRPEHAVVPLF